MRDGTPRRVRASVVRGLSYSGDMPPALSPSRAGDFMQCPLLYRFRVVDRLPEPPSPAAARGTLVHAVLERLFDLPPHRRTVEEASALVPSAWASLVEQRPELRDLIAADRPGEGVAPAEQVGASGAGAPASPGEVVGAPAESAPGEVATVAAATASAAQEAWFEGAVRLVERWFTLEDPTRLEPAERELYVETDLDGLLLRGYVDRIDVAPDGRMRVVDYKTGRAPSPLFEGKALFQMKFYALVLWRLHGRVPTLLQLVYLGNGELLTYAPDEADLLAVERKVRALWAAIERAAVTGDFRARPSRLCDWCDHRALCPAWGGTPPPLPDSASELALDPAASGRVEVAVD